MQVIDTCFLIPFSWRWFEWFDEGIRAYVTGMSKIILLSRLLLFYVDGYYQVTMWVHKGLI